MKKLSFKIMLSIIICSITTSTILCVVSIMQTSTVMNQEVEQMLSYGSEKYSNQLSTIFKNTEGLVDSLAANVSVTFDINEHKDGANYIKTYKEYLENIIEETLKYSDIAYGLYFTFNPEITAPSQEEVWYAMKEDGQPYSVNPDLSLNLRDFSEPIQENMLYYFQPILTNQGAWSGPYVDPDVNFEMLSYSRAVYVGGVLIGVAGADILTEDTIDIVKTMKIYQGGTSFLFNRDFDIVAFSDDIDEIRYKKNESLIKEHLLEKPSDVLRYIDENEEYILAFSEISNGWVLGISQPSKEVFSHTRGLVLMLTLLTVACILVAIVFGIILAKRLAKPILSASDELKLIEMGDYTHNIPKEFLERDDEVGDFHNAILAIQSELKHEAELNREKDVFMIYQSKQAKIGEMVGNISHQWKQPLNTINLILTNLYDDYKYQELDEKQFEKTINTLRKIVDNMVATIKDFTDFLKPSKENTNFDLAESINMALDLMEVSLKYNQISMKVDIASGIKIRGFQNEFSHVLFNVINNARDGIIESQVEDKYISIRAFTKDKEVVIEITNTGKQIPDEILEKLFHPYFTTKEDNDGTGVGLYISRIIVEQRMNGKIQLENVADGVCCRIVLKIEEED
ncbi:MAG: ATP-binding protein [Anaerovoracaceae bacterium]|nr:ATP-binding protein [Anaerovoracaceae bacterium]